MTSSHEGSSPCIYIKLLFYKKIKIKTRPVSGLLNRIVYLVNNKCIH